MEIINKYQDAKIYKITCNVTNQIYIGSTTKTLNHRLSEHKSDYKRYINNEHNNVTSFKILENNDYKIELVEYFPCNNKKELEIRERYYIENIECVNKFIPTRTKKEYDNEYRENNKDKIKEYKEDNKDNCSDSFV